MNDLIKSFEQKLVAFDQESIERDLIIKDKKEKEKIENDNYWSNFKKFQEEFEKLVCTDFKKLYSALKAPLMQRNIVLRNESHRNIGRKYFYIKFYTYALISLSDRSLGVSDRWNKQAFILLKGDHVKNTISLYDCNQDLEYISTFFENNVLDNPLEQFLIEDYKFTLVKPHIEKWLDRNLDRILKTENYKSNNNII